MRLSRRVARASAVDQRREPPPAECATLFTLSIGQKAAGFASCLLASLARFMIAIKFIPPSRGFQVKYSLNLYLSATVKQSIFPFFKLDVQLRPVENTESQIKAILLFMTVGGPKSKTLP